MRANYEVYATPQFRVLSDDQIEEIYFAALDVLERVGTHIYGAEALALLGDAGCLISDAASASSSTDGAEGLARLPAWLVQEALSDDIVPTYPEE